LIVTGTTTSGQVSVGDSLTLIPQNKPVKVKSIQVFHQNVTSVPQGFRVGMGVLGVENEDLERGNILTNTPDLFSSHELIEIQFHINSYFKRIIRFGSQITCTFGMVTKNARIFPFYESDSKKILQKEINQDTNGSKSAVLKAFVWFDEPLYLMQHQTILLSQLDLAPTTLRFFGVGSICDSQIIKENLEINYIKVKSGRVKNANYGNNTVLVEDLAQSKEGAETLMGQVLEPPFGKILGTFANKGAVIVQTSRTGQIKEGDSCELRLYRTLKIQKSKSYDYLWQEKDT